MRGLITVLAVAAALAASGKLAAERDVVVVVERIQDLNLTDEQESKIAEARKECREKIGKAAKELAALVKEEVEKVKGVLTAEQKAKFAETKDERKECREECLAHKIAHLKELDVTDAEMEQIAEIRKEYRPRIAKALEGLKGTLTDEQKKAREEALKAGKSRKEVIASLKLTDEQKEKVEAAGKQVATIVREEMEKIGDLLTEGQKEKLAEFKEERREQVRDRMAHRIANLKDLSLTEEQATKIMEIRKEFRPKVHEAGNNLRAANREAIEKVMSIIKG